MIWKRKKKETKPDPDPGYGGLFTRDEARLLKLAELFLAYARTGYSPDLAQERRQNQEMILLCKLLRDPFKAPEQMFQYMKALKRLVDRLHEEHRDLL